MKPKKTEYEGDIFRSRLEARWAVFFAQLGIRYVYEPDQLYLPVLDEVYTPDFDLPTLNWYAEVKPEWPTRLELTKARESFRVGKRSGTVLLIGQPDYRCYWVLNLDPITSQADESAILFIKGGFNAAEDHETAIEGLPPYYFDADYRCAVEYARKSRFDGFDDDRRTMREIYA